MSLRLSYILIALSGILGVILLGAYFGVGFSVGLTQLSSSATMAKVVSLGIQHHNLWLLGAWLQATSR